MKQLNWTKYFVGSIRAKLQWASALLLISGIASVVWMSSSLYTEQAVSFIFNSATETADRISLQFRREIEQTLDKSRSWVKQVYTFEPTSEKRNSQLKVLLDGDSSVLGIQVFDHQSQMIELSAAQNDSMTSGWVFPVQQAKELSTSQLKFFHTSEAGNKTTSVLAPLLELDGIVQKSILILLEPKLFSQTFKSDGVSEIFMFSSNGQLVFRSNTIPGEGIDLDKQIPNALIDGSKSVASQGTVSVQNQKGKRYLGSYAKAGIADLCVGVLLPEERAFEAPRHVTKRSIYLGLSILALAFIFAIFFAESFGRPIRALTDMAIKVASGDFSVQLKASSRDELAVLTKTFNSMARGLEERDRIKSVFGKFHSKAVVDQLLNNQKSHLGGERIPVTVFFSDIRSFTTKSEKMQPEQVVEMLNEYMSEMVDVIEKYQGVVDKYVGDAIMAIWGIGSNHPQKDAENAMRACLEMRERLAVLNEKRKARNDEELKIGMGLNSGIVIAGNIGSPKRMEYTVIGDTVNTASRLESLTKENFTDLLVSESTKQLLPENLFAFEEPIETKAKGKEDLVKVYKCAGYVSIPTEEAKAA